MTFIRAASFLLAMCLALALAPTDGLAAPKRLRLYHPNPAGDPFDNPTAAMAQVFARLVEKGTDGSVTVEVLSEQEFAQGPVATLIQRGSIQSGILTEGELSTLYPMIEILDVPFAFSSVATTYKVFDGPFGAQLGRDILAKTGLAVLGYGDTGGFFIFTLTKARVRGPTDLRGLSIRTMPLQTHRLFIQALGAKPVIIPFPKLKEGLERGLADGQMNPVPIVSFAGLADVQAEAVLTDHFFTPYVWCMNFSFMESLSAAERRAIFEAARSAIVAGRGLCRIIEASERGLPALAAKMHVQTVSAEQRSQYRTLTVPAIKNYLLGTYGEEGRVMLGAFQAAIEEAEAHP